MSKNDGLKSTAVHEAAGMAEDPAIEHLVRRAREFEKKVCDRAESLLRDRRRIYPEARIEETIYQAAVDLVPPNLWAWSVTYAYGGEVHFFITRYLGE